jgi:hypothetical protein
VLLLTVESLRADQLRAYGGNRDVMPALEKLANEARVFLNTYTQSGHTNYANNDNSLIVSLPVALGNRTRLSQKSDLSAGLDLRRAKGFALSHGDLLFVKRKLGRNDQLP